MKPRSPGRTRKTLRALLWIGAGAALALLVVRVFIGDVYPVSSSSMRPTIYAGSGVAGDASETEWVFVSYDRSAPERFELVVVSPENGGEPLVKRVVGLSGEELRLARGDLFVNGAVLGAVAGDGRLLPLWDSRAQPWNEWLSLELTPAGPWKQVEQVLLLDALEDPGPPALAQLHKPARDGYLSPQGQRVAGLHAVNDLALELTLSGLELGAGDAGLLLTLTESGDAFSLVLRRLEADGRAPGEFEARLLRATTEAPAQDLHPGEGTDGVELLAAGLVTLASTQALRLEFRNVDDRLTVLLDDALVLQHRYERNRPHERAGVASEHVPPRVAWGGSGLRVRVERIRILRDLFWVPQGAFAVGEALLLGPDEVFVLGDNSRSSTDSRSFGPVDLGRIEGRAKAVIWPLSQARRLRTQ